MTKIDLTALLNRPGYGSAAKELIMGGHWSDNGPGQKKYVVNVISSVEVTEAVVVTAENETEAKRKAIYSCSLDDVDGTEIVGIVAE